MLKMQIGNSILAYYCQTRSHYYKSKLTIYESNRYEALNGNLLNNTRDK